MFLQHDPSFQAVLAVLCLVMSMSANVYFRPFKSKKVFMLDSLATFANALRRWRFDVFLGGGERINGKHDRVVFILLVAAIILWAIIATTLEVDDVTTSGMAPYRATA